MKVTVNAGSIGSQNNAEVMNMVAAPAVAAPAKEIANAVPVSPNVTVSPGAVFISHSSRDSALARALSDLLIRALRLEAAAVRCTSVDGHRLAAGAPVSETLRMEIRGAAAFVAFLTPQSLQSPYVLFELGARWGQGTSFMPVIGPAVVAGDLPPPLSELNVLRMDQSAQVEQLVHEVGQLLKRTPEPSYSYAEVLRRVVDGAAAPADT